jgi:hypothetical protein
MEPTLEAGITIGSWTLQKLDPARPYHWICICSCDARTVRSIRDYSLKSGRSQSCGCLRSKVLSKRRTHGLSNTPEYKAWQRMLYRVRHDPGYIKKGIKVCSRWQKFENFLADVRARPAGKRISPDRVDNNGDYEPDNVRWATPTVQNRNKGNNVQIESQTFGTKPQAEWVAILNERTVEHWDTRRLKSAIRSMGTIDRVLSGWEIDLDAQYSTLADLIAHEHELVAA